MRKDVVAEGRMSVIGAASRRYKTITFVRRESLPHPVADGAVPLDDRD
jgi:hypothetical protein